MAISALHSSATGLRALSTELDIIANNLANVNTTGFKASRANFEDLLYQEKKQPGVENATATRSPAGLYVGLGTQVSNTQLDFSKGAPISTNSPLDVYIDGIGFLKVTIPDDRGGVAYTRAGNLMLNADGDLVLGSSDGPRVIPNINIDPQARQVSISSTGLISATLPGQNEPTEVGQLELASFVNPAGLAALGGNLYIETAASGPPIEGEPGDGNLGTILQSHLESSNVDAVTELVNLIKTQRSFEMNSQSIQAADDALQVIGNLRRG